MDELSHEELVSKCKHYLNLAQRAKQAKDDAFKKVELLELKIQQLEDHEKIKNADSNEVSKASTIDHLEEQLESCERRISRLTNENEKLLTDIDASELKCKHLEEELKECCKEAEVAELKAQNKKLQEKLEDANQTRKAVVKKLEEVSTETRQLIENSEQISDENELLKKQVTTLLDSKKNYEFEIEKLKEKFAKVTVANELIKEENVRIQEANDAFKKSLLEKSKELEQSSLNSLEVAQNKDYISSLTSKIETIEKCNLSLQKELNDSLNSNLVEKNKNLKKELLSASENLTSSRQKLIKLKETVVNEISALLADKDAQDKNLLDAKVYLNNIKNIKLVSLKKKISRLRIKNQALTNERDSLSAELSKAVSSTKDVVNSNCNQGSLEPANDEPRPISENNQEKLKLKCDDFERQLDSAVSKINGLEAEKQDYEELKLRCDELESQLNSAVSTINDLEAEKQDSQTALRKSESDLNIERFKFQKCLTDRSLCIAEGEDLKVEKETLLTEVKNLKTLVETLQNDIIKSNETLKTEEEEHLRSINELNAQIQHLEEEHAQQLNSLKTLVETSQNDVKKLNETLKTEEENHLRSIDELKAQIKHSEEEKAQQLNSLKTENQAKNEELKRQADEIQKLRESVEENKIIKKKLNDCINLINQLETKNLNQENLRERVKSLETALKEGELKKCELALNKESTSSIILKAKELQLFKQDFKEFVESSFKDLSTFSCTMNQEILEKVNGLLDTKKRDQADLLSEMQEMVTILKQRGEFISKLEQKLTEKSEEIKEAAASFNSRINQLQDENANLTKKVEEENSNKTSLKESLAKSEERLIAVHQELQSKNLVIDELKIEISKLESSLKEKEEVITSNEQDLNRLRDIHENDTLSTSTISRSEEVNRLKDVEESFEDRYGKLKVVAIKLKKKCNDLTRQLESERKKSLDELTESQQRVQQLTAKLKNTQCLQQELDKAADNIERYQNDLKSFQKKLDVERLEKIKFQEERDSIRSELKEKQAEIENLSKEKATLKNSADSVSKEIESLRKEKKAAELISQEKEKELNKMREKLVEKEKEVISLNQRLDKAQGASNKQNVLNRELQDSEKTVSDLKQQLNAEKSRAKNLKDELQVAQSVKITLNDQISTLETQMSAEQKKSAKLAEALKSAEGKISEIENSLKKCKTEISSLNEKFEKEKSHSEDLSLQLADVSSQFAKFKDSADNQRKSLIDQINSLTAQMDKSKRLLKESEEECETLKADFQSYKIRAQSVLEKHRKENLNKKDEDLFKIRLEQVEESNKSLKLQLDNISTELDTANLELKKALSDKDSSDKSLKETKQVLIKRNKELDECKNEMKSFKVKTDLLVSCHKSQLEEMKRKYETELQVLQERITLLQYESPKSNAQDLMKDSSDSTSIKANPDFEYPATREEGEGSENTELSPVTFRSGAIMKKPTITPLDQLLESRDLNTEDEAVQIDELKHNLVSYQSQVQHLSALLNESEKNCARNEQLNSFLKEEIRRLERSLERQPHITNSEYLKNVIFKFITLQSGDERTRLVPVLDTILKLSPDESKKLSAVASGNSEALSGWNFLGW